jgi:hypothetical protein
MTSWDSRGVASRSKERRPSPPGSELQSSWCHDELRAIATDAHRHFRELVAASGSDPEDLVFHPGGIVGTKLHGPNVLDEPRPPDATTLRIGPFVDRLLAGEASLGDLGELLAEVDRRPDLTAIDAGSRRPIGTPSRYVEFDLRPASRAMCAPLESSLQELEQHWDPEIREKEAEALVSELKLDTWPWLATDLIRRYMGTLESIIRGTPLRLEYRTGDPRRGGSEPPGLAIPAFEPTGDPMADSARLTRFQTRVNEVREELEQAKRAQMPTSARTRRAHASERKTYRRDAGWLFENLASATSLRKIAERDLGSVDRWTDVQRSVNRAKSYLSLANIPWPPGPDRRDAR